MKRKVFILLIIILSIILVGCSKNETSKKSTTKKESSTLVTGPSCKKDFDWQSLEYIADIEKEKLKSFDIITTYKYSDLDSMKSACANNKNEEKEVNSKNIYVKYQVTCNEDKKTITIEKNYDTEKSMAEANIKDMLSYVYKYIKDDGKFDLDGWKNENIKDGFSCN